MRVSRQVKFDSAHLLPNYEGKCRNPHGHTWTVEVTCSGNIRGNGMVVDFGALKDFLNVVQNRFDHKDLNEIIPNPTAENICMEIRKEFEAWCSLWEVEWESVKIWEGCSSSYVELVKRDEKR